jgi:hypothetical protein
MRNINEFNIPAGNSHGYEILYFGVNLILMLNYRLSFDVEVKNSNKEIQVLIFSRKDVPAWKENRSSQITPYYGNQGTRINDVFRPTIDYVKCEKKRILSLEVTSEDVHDGKMLQKLVDGASENNKVKRLLADGMYDSNNNFRYLSKNHIKPGIKTRRNSKVKSTNCSARNISVLRQQTSLTRWKRSVSYGYRWMTETVFSSIKRTFGEHVTARKFPYMVKEIFLKAALYNMFNQMM